MECLVYGVGSTYVYEVHETLLRLGWAVRAYVANQDGFRPHGLVPLVDVNELPHEWRRLPVLFPIVTPGYRQAIAAEASARGFSTFPAVVDPTAIMATSVEVGAGALINAGSVVGANTTLGRFALLNRSVSVGHDVVLEDYVSLAPACVLCGATTVARGGFVGAGAVLNPEVSVGENAVVGAGSVVTRDVPAHALAVGNPARVVREGCPGYNGVSVRGEG